jgi:hypothetical protein
VERSIADLTADLTAGTLPEGSAARRGDRLQRVQIGPMGLAHRLRLAGVFAAG